MGSATNGIVGTHIAAGGRQLVVGKDDRDIVVIRVVNPNNIFNEHFRDTTFKDSPTTSDWNTTLFRLASSSSDNHSIIHNSVTTFKSIFLNQQTITKATINATETRWNPNDKIAYFLSADGGNNWEEATIGIPHTFTNTGQNLKCKIVFFTNGGKDTYIERFRISYEVTV